MSSEPSTSENPFDIVGCSGSFQNIDPHVLLHNALSQAGQKRQAQSRGRNHGSSQPTPADPEQMEKIRKHPLYPVLRLMAEKCEIAACDLRKSAFQIDDVKALIEELQRKGVTQETNDTQVQVDSLLVDAIIVLRVQLAELQRVASLVDDFKTKYAGALRRRVSHESLVGEGADSDDDGNLSDGDQGLSSSRPHGEHTTMAMMTTPSGTVSIPLPINISSSITSNASLAMPVSLSLNSHHSLQANSVAMSPSKSKRQRFDFTSIENCNLDPAATEDSNGS